MYSINTLLDETLFLFQHRVSHGLLSTRVYSCNIMFAAYLLHLRLAADADLPAGA